jgi:pimeloyl-ACP methyl ester carboxylesterase
MDVDEHGWIVRETGAPGAARGVLLLPGALATADFYDDLLASPCLAGAPLRFVATTLPGFGGTPPPEDPGTPAYAAGALRLAREHGCDTVVGHSLGANVAIEMAVSGGFRGALVLLSPSFSRRDESRVPRALDRVARVAGRWPYVLVVRMMGPAMGGAFPPARRDRLVGVLRANDPDFLRRQTRLYLHHLDESGSLVDALCRSGVPAWIAFGEHDDVGLTGAERDGLLACPTVRLSEFPGEGHFALVNRPEDVARLVLAAAAGSVSA